MNHPHFNQFVFKKMPEKAQDIFMKKVNKFMNEDKVGIQFWSKVIVAKKKKN